MQEGHETNQEGQNHQRGRGEHVLGGQHTQIARPPQYSEAP